MSISRGFVFRRGFHLSSGVSPLTGSLAFRREFRLSPEVLSLTREFRLSPLTGFKSRLSPFSTMVPSNNQHTDPKQKAHSIIDSLPGNSLLTKTGYITVGTGLVALTISKELYVFNEETVVLLAFIGLIIPLYRVLRKPFNEWFEEQQKRVNSVLDQAQEDHKTAVKDRINNIGQVGDIVDITKALFEMSKETAKLDAEAFELKQKATVAAEIKAVLDSWVRYEASLREREQKDLANYVIERVMTQLRDEKTQQEILNQSIQDVERIVNSKTA